MEILRHLSVEQVALVSLASIFVAIILVDRLKTLSPSLPKEISNGRVDLLIKRLDRLEDRIFTEISCLRTEISTLREQFGKLNGALNIHIKEAKEKMG